MKIIFVYPDIIEPLGVEYLMAVCLADGHVVDHLYYNPINSFYDRTLTKISYKQIAEQIIYKKPDIVGFSCVTDNYQLQLECARALKKIAPNIITIFGGIHVTATPEKVIMNHEVDCVAIGEAEASLRAFLKAGEQDGRFILPEKAIQGIVFKNGTSIIGEFKEGHLADLNSFPFPYKIPFFSAGKNYYWDYKIMTSRGCPFSCSYCFNAFMHKMRGGSHFRRRSTENVIAELLWAQKQYHIKFVSFLDDAFTSDKDWLIKFCKDYKEQINLPFNFGTIPWYIDEKIAQTLSDAGCVAANIGIQSLNKDICNKILHRKSNNSKIIQSMEDLKKAGILVSVDHMLGIPGDSTKIQEDSIRFYNEHRPDIIRIFWLKYYPKTPIVNIALHHGDLNERDLNFLEAGKCLTDNTIGNGGDTRNQDQYYGVAVLLNFLPILPKKIVEILIRKKIYRTFKIKNYLIVVALSRFIISISKENFIVDRMYIRNTIDMVFLKKIESMISRFKKFIF